MSDVCKALQHL